MRAIRAQLMLAKTARRHKISEERADAAEVFG